MEHTFQLKLITPLACLSVFLAFVDSRLSVDLDKFTCCNLNFQCDILGGGKSGMYLDHKDSHNESKSQT